MAAHGFFVKGAGALGDKMTVFQTDRLLVQPGIANDGRRDLSVIGLDDSDSILDHVLLGKLKGRSV